jgi:Flp pilus assembly protein TadB
VSKPRPGTPEVHRITTAPEPLADDLARRTRRYLIQMGIRVVCFIAAIVTWDRVPMWVSALLLVGAVVLPYVAVILANAGRERRDDPLETIDPRALTSHPHDRPRDDGPPA